MRVFVVFSLLICFNAFAQDSKELIGILNIDMEGSPALIYGSDGKIYEADETNDELMSRLKFAQKNQVEVEINRGEFGQIQDMLDSREKIFEVSLVNKIIEIDTILNPKVYGHTKLFQSEGNLQNEDVTDFKDIETVGRLFKSQRSDTKWKSQCYNRAHVWAWEFYKRYYQGERIKAGKMWIFFSKNYIRRHEYKWWFHIAPYVTVNGNVKIMDKSFTKSPTAPSDWVNSVVDYKIECKEVYKYSEYSEDQDRASCFFIRTSLYYWQPWQIENAETKNEERVEWVEWELKKAYKNAISWFAKVP